jgi:single-strand DNA-binding protein
MYSTTVVVGRLVKEPEMSYGTKGTPILKMRVQAYMGQDYKEYFDVKVFGKLGEACEKYLKAKSMVLVRGKVKLNQWEYQGRNFASLELLGDEVRFLDKALGSGEKTEQSEPDGSPFDDDPWS